MWHACTPTVRYVYQVHPPRRQIQKHFKACNELAKAVKSAVNDLYGARIYFRNECQKRKQEEQRDNLKRRRCLHGEGAPGDNAGAGSAIIPAGTVFDYRDTKFPAYTAEEFKKVDLATARSPILVTGTKLLESMNKDSTFKKELSDCMTSFRVHPGRQGGVKVGIVDDSLRSIVRSWLTQAMPPHVAHELGSLPEATREKLKDHGSFLCVVLKPLLGRNPTTDTPSHKESCEPDMWLRASSTDMAIQEQLNLTALRMTMQGTRLVVVARLASLGEHVRNLKGSKAMKSPISCLATMQWLKSATLEQVKQAASEGVQFWAGSAGPGDLMFLPPGVVRVEKYSGGEDSVGLRMSFYHNSEPDGADILRIAKADLLMMGKQNQLVNAMLEVKEAQSSNAIADEPRTIEKPAQPKQRGEEKVLKEKVLKESQEDEVAPEKENGDAKDAPE